MATKQDRIAELLASNIPPDMVASLTGTTTSYIASLTSNPEFKSYVLDLATEKAEGEVTDTRASEHMSLKDRMSATRAKLLDKIVGDIPMYSPTEALKAFDVIHKGLESIEKNDLLRKGLTSPSTNAGVIINGQVVQNVVHLHMPAAVLPDIVYGPNKEILEIGGRTTASMPMAALQEQLDASMEGLQQNNSKWGAAEDALYAPIQNR